MVFDPFSQVLPQTEPEVMTETVFVTSPPKLLFGVDEKIVVGIITGMLILNFLQCIDR